MTSWRLNGFLKQLLLAAATDVTAAAADTNAAAAADTNTAAAAKC